MKAFSVFLNDINDGTSHAAITADFATLLQTVQNTGRGGALTLKLKVMPAVKGTSGNVDRVVISIEHALTLPKPEQPTDFFYLSEDGEPVRNHPRQQSLELRDIAEQRPTILKNAS